MVNNKTIKKNLTRKERGRLNKLNSIHPKDWKPNEEYEFYLLLGKKYLGDSTRKTKKYNQRQKRFYRNQGMFALRKSNKIKSKYQLDTINTH